MTSPKAMKARTALRIALRNIDPSVTFTTQQLDAVQKYIKQLEPKGLGVKG